MKVREHVYICRVCGTGRVNAQRRGGDWFTTFHRPDGSREISIHVPPCELGPLTPKYLKAHELAIIRSEVRW